LKIKVDENIGRSGVSLLRQAGHDVMSVAEQGLSGAADEAIFQVCVSERRALVTLDRDFGQVPRFPPKQGAGIVVLELGAPATKQLLQSRLREFLTLATTRPVEGELWIVEAGRVRVHLERGDE
jgi:predicted nuclease of predicted toxin-antitoxin system